MTLLHQAAQKAVARSVLALTSAEAGLDYFLNVKEASLFVAGARNDVRTALEALAALQHQEVPREPVAQIRGGDLYWLVAGNEKLPEGALLYASPSTTQQQEAGNGGLVVLNGLDVLERMDYRPGDRVLVENFLRILGERGMWVIANPLLPAAPSTPESAEKDDAGGVDVPREGQS